MERLPQLLIDVTKPEAVNEAQTLLQELLKAPEVFNALFEIINTNLDLQKSAIVFIGVAFSFQPEISPELFELIKKSLIHLIFSPLRIEIIDLLCGTIDKILTSITIQQWPELLPAAVDSIQNSSLIINSVSVIATLVGHMNDEMKESIVKSIIPLVNESLAYDSWPIRIAGMEILNELAPIIITSGSISEQLLMFLQFPRDSDSFTNPDISNYLIRCWGIVNSFVSRGFVEDQLLDALFSASLEVVSNESIDPYNRMFVLQLVMVHI